MSDEPAFVVLMRVHLHFPDVGSLKGKRAELMRVKARLRSAAAPRSPRSHITTRGNVRRLR